jgi:hypothetical protein
MPAGATKKNYLKKGLSPALVESKGAKKTRGVMD